MPARDLDLAYVYYGLRLRKIRFDLSGSRMDELVRRPAPPHLIASAFTTQTKTRTDVGGDAPRV